MHPLCEILVHISAPSGASADKRYRQQASNLLQFQPGNRIDILPARYGNDQGQDTNASEGKGFGKAHPVPGEDLDSEYGSFDASLLATPGPAAGRDLGALRTILRKSVTKKPLIPPALLPETPLSKCPPPEIHALSSAHPQNDSMAKKEIDESKILVAQTPTSPRPRMAPLANLQKSPRPLRRSQSGAWEPPSTVPDSQPIFHPPKHSISSSPQSSMYQRASPNPKRRRQQTSSPAQGPRTSVATDVRSSQPSQKDFALVIHSSSQYTTPSKSSNVKTIHSVAAPPPPVDITPFRTHITRDLDVLAAGMEKSMKKAIAAEFSDKQEYPPSRTLRVHERGHWNVHIDSFPPELKEHMWLFLESVVTSGRAGFNILLVVEEREHFPRPNQQATRTRLSVDRSKVHPKSNNRKKEEVLKLYCWGEVVVHMWIMLFIATKRQIKGLRAQWIDAAGEVVVQMK